MSEPVSVPMGPLAMHFKRRADFFEQEAYNLAVFLESQALQQTILSTLTEDRTGKDPIEHPESNTPYVTAPDGTSATPVEEE